MDLFRNTRHQWVMPIVFLVIFDVAVAATQKEETIFSTTGEYWAIPNADLIDSGSIACSGNFTYLSDGKQLRDFTLFSGATNSSGRCLYKNPVQLLEPPSLKSVSSFSTAFLLQISGSGVSQDLSGSAGLTFIITTNESGWLNYASNQQQLNSTFAVELDLSDFLVLAMRNVSLQVNVDSLNSLNVTRPVTNNGEETLAIGVLIEYDGPTQVLNVTVGDALFSSPPIISTNVSLMSVFQKQMFVGFSGSVTVNEGALSFPSISIIGWAFSSDGSILDIPPGSSHDEQRNTRVLIVAITAAALAVVLSLTSVIFVLQRRNSRLNSLAKKYGIGELDDLTRGPQSFKHKALTVATKSFSSNELLGSGGFGSVYKGKLWLRGAKTHTDVAVKRISATSSQGAREFLAEVKIIGRVQHRNLVRLLGWCHEKGELLLVYDYMPNGSLDHHLFIDKKNSQTPTYHNKLTWARRLKIVSGVATALAYLHEEWEQRVIHRDVKSSNVMLDSDFNARLGDFGLARLSEHGEAPESTFHLAGTHGYMAPELGRTLKATEKTDVYSFGALVLEVACGRRALLPIEHRRSHEEVLLVDMVWGLYQEEKELEAADPQLENAFDREEMTSLLKIGLLCSHPDPDERPTMREVLSIWKGSTPLRYLPRSKPVPVFLKTVISRDGEESEFRTDDSFTIQMEDIKQSSERSMLDYYESSPALRSRLSKSTPLPM